MLLSPCFELGALAREVKHALLVHKVDVEDPVPVNLTLLHLWLPSRPVLPRARSYGSPHFSSSFCVDASLFSREVRALGSCLVGSILILECSSCGREPVYIHLDRKVCVGCLDGAADRFPAGKVGLAPVVWMHLACHHGTGRWTAAYARSRPRKVVFSQSLPPQRHVGISPSF